MWKSFRIKACSSVIMSSVSCSLSSCLLSLAGGDGAERANVSDRHRPLLPSLMTSAASEVLAQVKSKL